MNKIRRYILLATATAGVGSLAKILLSNTHATDNLNLDEIEGASANQIAANKVSKNLALPAEPKMGINLSEINYYATEYPFVDLMKSSSGFNLDNLQDSSLQDENGYFTQIPEGANFATCLVVEAPENSKRDEYIKSGQYVFLYDGDAATIYNYDRVNRNKNTLEFKECRVVSQKPNRIVLNCDFTYGLRFNIHGLSASNPIKNVRIVPIAHEKTYLENPWKQEFLDLWKNMACLRFMDTMKTNNSTQSKWANRPKPTYVTYGMNDFIPNGKGMPLEMLVDMANRLNTNPWFCIPHLADDDYVKQFATYVKENLNPNLKAYIEYSNEIWNGGFVQTDYCDQQAKKLRLPRADGEKGEGGASEFKAYRSKQIFTIFDSVYGAARKERVIRVLASQAAWTAMSEAVCLSGQAYKHADVLAIAPYPQFNVSPDGELKENIIKNWTLDKLFDFLNKKSLPETIGWIEESKKVADRFGLKLIAYEGGQHCVGTAGSENNEAVTKLLMQANADPRMGEMYTELLNAWSKAGGDLFCHYSSVGPWSKWGCWTLLQSLYQPVTSSPKYMAIMQWANNVGQKLKA